MRAKYHQNNGDDYPYLDVCDERLPLPGPVDEGEEVSQTPLRVNWDRYPIPSLYDTFHCLILADYSRENSYSPKGLVLECVDPKLNLYRRMGAFRGKEPNFEEYWTNPAVIEKVRALETEEFYIK